MAYNITHFLPAEITQKLRSRMQIRFLKRLFEYLARHLLATINTVAVKNNKVTSNNLMMPSLGCFTNTHLRKIKFSLVFKAFHCVYI